MKFQSRIRSRWKMWAGAVCLVGAFGACGSIRNSDPVQELARVDLFAGSVVRGPASSGLTPDLVLLQINDVYETLPVSGGKLGGVTRFASLVREMKQRFPDASMSVLAGDFLSPSAQGTALLEGTSTRTFAGAQMVAALNAAGLDLAIFGNHEFDIDAEDLRARVREAKFGWISGNVRDTAGRPAFDLPPNAVRVFRSASGAQVRVGFISVTIDSNKVPYVKYLPRLDFIKAQVNELRPKVDVLVAVTHLSIEQDREIAAGVPGIDLIIGGHEHEAHYERFGPRQVPIAKADSNIRSAFLHRIVVEPRSKHVTVESMLRPVDARVAEEPETRRVAQGWLGRAFEAFRKTGIDPTRVVAQSKVDLDGTEGTVRKKSSAMTEIVGRSLLHRFPDSDLAIFIGGGIRIDDVIPAGPVTEYELIRILPFADPTHQIELKGEVLTELMKRNASKAGSGGFMHFVGLRGPIQPGKVYKVATIEFLLGMLKGKFDPGRVKHGAGDQRAALREYLESLAGGIGLRPTG